MNRVIDALSRRVILLTTMHANMVGFNTFKELYMGDLSFGKIYVEVTTGERNDYVMLNGYLFCGLQLCVLDCLLREKILRELHG